LKFKRIRRPNMGTLKFKARSRHQRAPARPRRHATHRRPGTPPPAGWPRARGRQHHHSRTPPKRNPPWGAFSLCVAVCRRPGRTPRRASRRRSAVHLGRRAPCLNSPVLAPRHHAHTSRMRRPPIKVSHPIFRRKPSAYLYACQDQVSCI
jgi:hypothetical protein